MKKETLDIILNTWLTSGFSIWAMVYFKDYFFSLDRNILMMAAGVLMGISIIGNILTVVWKAWKETRPITQK